VSSYSVLRKLGLLRFLATWWKSKIQAGAFGQGAVPHALAALPSFPWLPKPIERIWRWMFIINRLFFLTMACLIFLSFYFCAKAFGIINYFLAMKLKFIFEIEIFIYIFLLFFVSFLFKD